MRRGGRPYSAQRTLYMQGIRDQEATDPFSVLASEPGGWAGRKGGRTVPQMHRHKRFAGRLPPNRCPLTESPHHVLLCSLGTSRCRPVDEAASTELVKLRPPGQPDPPFKSSR